MANTKFRINMKSIPIVFLDGWLVRLEKWAFGWVHEGKHTEATEYDEKVRHTDRIYSDDYSVALDIEYNTIERKTRFTTYRDFFRVSPYSYNVIFHLFEKISNLFAFLRRILMYIVDAVLGFVLFAVIFGFIVQDYSILESTKDVIFPFLLLYASLIVLPSLLFALGGIILRKIFSIDKHVEEQLKANGYDPNWRNQ